MRRTFAIRAGLPAVALSALMAGCGGGSGGGEEMPVVDMRDPSFSGPGGGAPAQAAPAPAAPAAPVQGAPGGVGQAAPPNDMIAAQMAGQGGGPIASGPAASSPIASGGPAAASPSGPAAAAPAEGAASGGGAAAAGNLALNEMLSAANAANDPGAEPGQSGGPGQGSSSQSAPAGMAAGNNQQEMMAMMGAQGGMDSSGMMAPGMAPGGPAGPGRGGMNDFDEFAEYGPGGGSPAGGEFGSGMAAGGFDDGFGAQAGMFGQGGADEPADFESPQGAVEAFLDAIEAKDIQRLQEATALRAPQQAETAARRKTFQAIREMSLTAEEFDAIAENMDGFEIARMSRPTEAGILTFLLQKEGEYGSTLLRSIDVRKERSGWKVLDVSGISELKRMGGRAMQQRNRDNGNDSGYGGSGRP